ncbi:MAG TPA: hypothetical protein VK815_11585 [Candidatus Acidoferrales bacterium]|nr:hypothetical protein [Candidatus Acidoferrales bacterium]
MKAFIAWLGFMVAVAKAADFQSPYLTVGFERQAAEFSCFAVDGLGQGKASENPVMPTGVTNGALQFFQTGTNRFGWTLPGADGRTVTAWEIICGEKSLTLISRAGVLTNVPPLVLQFDQKARHATLLGLMQPDERMMQLPCVLHLPDQGSVLISSSVAKAALGYDARRRQVPRAFVRVSFPAATPARPQMEYHLDVAAIYPHLPQIAGDARFDGFRRGFLNIFQVNPRVQMLANNASSDVCPFTLYMYAAVAQHAPPLADGLSAFDLVRMTLDRYLAGAKGYGQVGYACTPVDADLVAWHTPWTTLDTYPSLLIAACDYVEGTKDAEWAKKNYAQLAEWGREMLAQDKDGNGLVEYPSTGNFGDRPAENRRPANWWDTINFGHEDAYANALTYHACRELATLARRLDHPDDAIFFDRGADKLRAAYVPAFLDPKTGVLAGWRSADGTLHDYWFTFVQGVAITYGLVDKPVANAIMDHLLQKMREVGYTNFSIGLPGNLVPIPKGDYILQHHPPTRFGEPLLDDGSDGFQYYENGGATGCFAWFTVKALYQLGRPEEARHIFLPMLAGYAAGNFQGFDANGASRDWRDWKGGGHGYEGLLVDNYLALLAVFDEAAAGDRR